MKIREIFKANKTVFSCEVYPPKSLDSMETIYDTIRELKEISLDFLSVTYGAGGGTKDRSIELCSKIKKEYSIESLMHLTCVNSKYDDITSILKKLKQEGIDNILALRGDIPLNHNREEVVSDFRYAADLVSFIKSKGDFSIGIAGYPEVHPESENSRSDIEYLKNKIDKGADYIITQLFFRNDYLYRFIDRLESANITIPVSAGIMPVSSVNILKKVISLSGATIPAKLNDLIDKYGDNAENMLKAGIEYASEQIIELISQKTDGIHLYIMNNSHIAKEISQNTGLR